MKKEFTEGEKIIIWLDYMTTIVKLNNISYSIPYRKSNKDDKTLNNYPLFGISTFKLDIKHNIKPFDKFCEEQNELASENLIGWYWRFKNRINLKK
jgi:hypothetical protein